MISTLRAVSRLPVGSSANSTDGSVDNGPGDRDALHLAARELRRCVRLPAGEADRGERFARSLVPLACAHAAIDERELHVLERGGAIEQVEALEDESDVVAAQQRALLPRQRADVHAAKAIDAAGRRSRQPRMFMAVDLPDPLGPMTATNSPGSTSKLTPASA